MKRTIRNPRAERRAIRQAQEAIAGPGLWRGMLNSMLITAGFVAVGLVMFFAMEAYCYSCPGYSCQSNMDCGTCACAKLEGQPYGACVFVGVEQ